MIQSGVHFHKWDEAIESCKSVLGAAPHKEAGYLAYNIAIGYEVLGAYDEAVKWAQDAYLNMEITSRNPVLRCFGLEKDQNSGWMSRWVAVRSEAGCAVSTASYFPAIPGSYFRYTSSRTLPYASKPNRIPRKILSVAVIAEAVRMQIMMAI